MESGKEPLELRVASHDDPSDDADEVIECRDCRFRHLSVLPSERDLKVRYEDDYYEKIKANYLTNQAKDGDWWHRVYSRRINRYRVALGEDFDLLDVGCGPGQFLISAKAKGIPSWGLEPSLAAVQWAGERGLSVFQGWPDGDTLKRLPRARVVQLDQVIEHVANPKKLFGRIHEYLPAGGAVSVIFANDFSDVQKAAVASLGLGRWWVQPSEHLNYFDAPSMERLLASCGFDVLYVQPTFPIDIFLLFGIDYVSKPREGPLAHRYRKNFEENLEKQFGGQYLDTLYLKLGELGIGRELEMVAIRR